jgi:hypothetical protein
MIIAENIIDNVTDSIKALPGNSSVNTVQHATINEAVFSMSSSPSSGGTTGLSNPFLSNDSLNTLRGSSDVCNKSDGVFRGVCTECL